MKRTVLCVSLLLFAVVAAGRDCAPGELEKLTSQPDRYIACFRTLTAATARVEQRRAALEEAVGSIYESAATQPQVRLAPIAREAWLRLRKLGAERPADGAVVVGIYLDNGLFREAVDIMKEASLGTVAENALPTFVPAVPAQAATPSYWRLSRDGRAFEQRYVDLDDKALVVVVAAPGCHFCNGAAQWISRSPALRKLFRNHSLWMDRPDPNFSPAYYAQWNRSFPDTPMDTVFDVRGWPMPKVWATPQFLFVRNGQLVASVSGWRKATPSRLLAAFEEIGVDTSDVPSRLVDEAFDDPSPSGKAAAGAPGS